MKRRPITPEDLASIIYVSDPQSSPDGKTILFVKSMIELDKNRTVSNLFSVDVVSGNVKQWTQGDKPGGMGRWSPDGSCVAFIAGREGPSAQIFLLPTDGGEARKLTDLPEGSIGAMAWSPDGKKIAITFRPVADNRTSKAEKERKEKNGSTPPLEIDELFYRMDGDGYFGGQRHAIYIIDTTTGKHTKLYDKDKLGMYSFDWLPNSSGLVVAHSAHKVEPLLKKPNDQLFLVPLKGKSTMLTGLKKGNKTSVKVSPDGKRVAYLGDDSLDDVWGVRNARLYVSPIKGGSQKCLSDKSDFCLQVATLSDTGAGGDSIVEWSTDAKKIYVMVGVHGTAQLASVDLEKDGVQIITKGDHVLGLGGFSQNKKMLGVTYGTPTRPAEIAVWDGKSLKTLTNFNKDFTNEVEIAKPSEMWLTAEDGTQVHAWCIKPVNAKPGKKYPAILEVHGGPHTQYGWAFFHEFQLLAAQGYVVVYSNPRGSKGYGEAFCSAIKRDWGNKDWEDIRAVRDWMQKQTFIDKKRIGIMGGSYGGYMANWAVGHTRDFKAAITDRCVFNWVSMSGNGDFPLNRDEYFGGCAWGPLENLTDIWRQSPAAYFDKARTPMLIIHSEGDLRCNVEQGEQVFYVLKQNNVPCRFVRYPQSTSHGMSRNGPIDMRIHRLGEIVKWWKKWMK